MDPYLFTVMTPGYKTGGHAVENASLVKCINNNSVCVFSVVATHSPFPGVSSGRLLVLGIVPVCAVSQQVNKNKTLLLAINTLFLGKN